MHVGRLRLSRIPSVAGTIYETIVPAGRGMLLGAAASVPINSITAGAVSAVGEIGRVITGSFVPHTLLFSGQLDDLTPLTASSASVSAPVSSPTFIAIATSAWAAGSSITTITPSAGRRIRIALTTQIVLSLVTDSYLYGYAIRP